MEFNCGISHDITSVTNRKEHHGTELKLAATVTCKVKGTAEQIIDSFSSTLRKALFHSQEGMEHLPKFTEVTGFPWGLEYKDSVIQFGADNSTDTQKFEKVKLSDFYFHLGKGGVVTVSYKASFPIEENELGHLASRIKEPCMVKFATPLDAVTEVEEKERELEEQHQ